MSDDLPESDRTRCEVWTRVMGYHRPTSAFNTGKQSEHAERCYFTESGLAANLPALRAAGQPALRLSRGMARAA